MTNNRFKDKPIRADLEFEKELQKIKLDRIINGKDKKMKSDRRLTKAIRRHKLWGTIKEDIINADLFED